LWFVLLVGVSVAVGQQLTVQNGSGPPVVLSRAEVEALPHVRVETDRSGEMVRFEGVLLRSVLEKAGVTFGDALKGKQLAAVLVVEAADRYRVAMALPELDPAFTEKQVLLVFLRNGKALDAKEGPYRILIPEEKRMARWVRQVTTLKIVDVP
jgi:hypothetical protein